MDMARLITSIVLRIRNEIDINVRQPLARIILPIKDEVERQAILSIKHIILEEVNVKDIQFVDDDSGIVHKSAKPNYPLLGKKLGSKMKLVAEKVNKFGTETITKLELQGFINIELSNGDNIQLDVKEIEIVRTGLVGWQVETEQGLSVAVDTEISHDLRIEGLTREFVNRVQNMRKEADFDVIDRISIGFTGEELLKEAVVSLNDYIKEETLAEEIQLKELEISDFKKSWEIGNQNCTISIRRNINT